MVRGPSPETLTFWRAIHSFLADAPKWFRWDRRHARFSAKGDAQATPHPITIVALVVSDHDRNVLSSIADREPIEIHFAESRVEAWDALNRLNSPLVLLIAIGRTRNGAQQYKFSLPRPAVPASSWLPGWLTTTSGKSSSAAADTTFLQNRFGPTMCPER